MGVFIGTISGAENTLGFIKTVFRHLDTKRYVIGLERGRTGYEHYQYAVSCAGDLREYVDANNLGWHVETAVSDGIWDYCAKEGRVHRYPYTHVDRERDRIRTFKQNIYQRNIVESLETQSDRNITVWIDREGGHGKTVLWLLGIQERWVLPVPRSKIRPGRISAWVCDAWDGEQVIWLDLPRNRTLDEEIAGELEEIKDGVAFDDRNHARYKIIRGTKILVTTNNWIPKAVYKALTEDRWDIHVMGSEPNCNTGSSPLIGGGEKG